jgi:hypothetical protein
VTEIREVVLPVRNVLRAQKIRTTAASTVCSDADTREKKSHRGSCTKRAGLQTCGCSNTDCIRRGSHYRVVQTTFKIADALITYA